MEYQDLATAYYSLTDKPQFLTEDLRPVEFRIEQRVSDFAYTIQTDDYKYHHFFEAKNWENQITWQQYRDDILDGFAKALDQEMEDEDVARFHLVTNTSLNPRLRQFFKDTEKLRNGSLRWKAFDKKYEVRNKSVFDSATILEDEDDFHKLAFGLSCHKHSKRELEVEFENFVRDCSPRNYKTPTTEILNIIKKKDSGVIRREYLENKGDIRLNRISGATSSETVSEIRSQLDQMANKDGNFEPNEIIKRQDITAKAGDYLTEQEGVSESSVENHVSSIDESFKDINEAWSTIENETSTIKERSKILRDHMPSDNTEESE